MSEATQNSLVPIGDDGFEAAAAEGAERILKGDLLKFSDGHWLVGREALLIKQDLRLVAMAGRRGEVNAVFGLTANRLPPAARREMIPWTRDSGGSDGRLVSLFSAAAPCRLA